MDRINKILDIKNFYYTDNKKNDDGVLFHIPTGRFFRVYDSKIKRSIKKSIEGKGIVGEAENILYDIDTETNVSICKNGCVECNDNKEISNAKDFTIRKLALVLTSSCNMRCKYCYANYGMYDYEQEESMTKESLEDILNYFINNFNSIGSIQFFYSGAVVKTNIQPFYNEPISVDKL